MLLETVDVIIQQSEAVRLVRHSMSGTGTILTALRLILQNCNLQHKQNTNLQHKSTKSHRFTAVKLLHKWLLHEQNQAEPRAEPTCAALN